MLQRELYIFDMNNYLNLLENSIVIDMDCDSVHFAYKECAVIGNARAVDITLKNQHSATTCVKDENYGVLSGSGIWVDNGCRGSFVVSLSKCITMLRKMSKHKYCPFYSKITEICL